MPNEYRQGMIDGLELALDVCEKHDVLPEVIDKINYYIRLIKEDKFTKIRLELGAFK
jgi:hypothetical protein